MYSLLRQWCSRFVVILYLERHWWSRLYVFDDLLPWKWLKFCKVFAFSLKTNIDSTKTFPNLQTFYLKNSMNFSLEFTILTRFCLLQGYIRQGYKIGAVLHPGVNPYTKFQKWFNSQDTNFRQQSMACKSAFNFHQNEL